MSSENPEQRAEQGADQLPAQAEEERREQPIARTGMFGAKTTGDTSGYGRLVIRQSPKVTAPRRISSTIASQWTRIESIARRTYSAGSLSRSATAAGRERPAGT